MLPGVYSSYRLSIIVVALAWRSLLYFLVMRTRVGMLIRAGASNREMVGALGINIKLLYTLRVRAGRGARGLAGMMQAAILTAQIGMGENILILAFVVIIIGGIGSIRGAFVAAIFVGLIDTVGRAYLPDFSALPEPIRRLHRGSGAFVDADLSRDGGRSDRAAGRACFRRPPNEAILNPRNVVVAALMRFCCCCRSIRGTTGNYFMLSLFTRIVILAMARSASISSGLWRHGEFRPRRLSRHRRLCVGILAYEGVYSGLAAVAAGDLACRRCSR
jgi:hypothetical protein